MILVLLEQESIRISLKVSKFIQTGVVEAYTRKTLQQTIRKQPTENVQPCARRIR